MKAISRRIKMIFRAIVVAGFLSVAGCGWMAGGVLDQVAGIPVSNVISDVKTTSDEYAQEKHEERVDELSREYEEFLRSRDTIEGAEKETEQSIVIQQQIDDKD